MTKKTKLSLEPYKGTRDFYPEDEFIQNYIISNMRAVAELYGYVPYNASLLEETELYKAKSNEEIISEQTYSFTDRGGREITLRPEMTPTLARMIAKKSKELSFPLRWYSVPNMFRYERPQRGRLREHWQLNVDIFGVAGVRADAEIIEIADNILKSFGIKKESEYEIRISNRKFLDSLFEELVGTKNTSQMRRLVDKMQKISEKEFKTEAKRFLKSEKQEKQFFEYLSTKNLSDISNWKKLDGFDELEKLMKNLKEKGIKNAVFDPSLVRGFDYYTGNVFEVYDTNPKNRRALFGGGRYDNLLSIFGVEDIPAVGFGVGDVTIRDFLEVHKLLPKYRPKTLVYICKIGDVSSEFIDKTANYLRMKGIPTSIDFTDRKIGVQIKTAVKQGIPYVICIGDDEVKSGKLSFKDLSSGKERKMSMKEIGDQLAEML